MFFLLVGLEVVWQMVLGSHHLIAALNIKHVITASHPIFCWLPSVLKEHLSLRLGPLHLVTRNSGVGGRQIRIVLGVQRVVSKTTCSRARHYMWCTQQVKILLSTLLNPSKFASQVLALTGTISFFFYFNAFLIKGACTYQVDNFPALPWLGLFNCGFLLVLYEVQAALFLSVIMVDLNYFLLLFIYLLVVLWIHFMMQHLLRILQIIVFMLLYGSHFALTICVCLCIALCSVILMLLNVSLVEESCALSLLFTMYALLNFLNVWMPSMWCFNSVSLELLILRIHVQTSLSALKWYCWAKVV